MTNEFDPLEELNSPEEAYSLEEILAEYGASREQKLMDEVAGELPPEVREAEEPPAPPPPEEPREEPELPLPPRPLSIEQAVGLTVDGVMEEREQESLLERKPRRGLFSRKRLEDTEKLYAPPEPEPEPEEEEPVGPEPPLEEAAVQARGAWRGAKKTVGWAMLLALLLAVPPAVEAAGYPIPGWTGILPVQAGVGLGALAAACLLCRGVFARAGRMLRRKRFTAEQLICLSAFAAAADCVGVFFLPQRSAAAPYALTACAALAFGQWGVSRSLRGRYDTYRTAAMDAAPPYLVTDLERGACKQAGRVEGFYTTAERDSDSVLWQTALTPVFLMASVVFAGLGSLGLGRGEDFLLNWSAILGASASLALPLAEALPFSRLSRRLYKAGGALAGCAGADAVSRRRSMIVTDTDLFPPGTIMFNGVETFGEDMPRAVSYAATVVRASGCGLRRLFDNLLVSEGGRLEELSDFSFYEEGGFSGMIHGETVLLGTASFMRKMEVLLPSGINLKTGIFLAVDRQLTAVFAVKYEPSENVDWALRIMRRNHITPILASRDPNVTPALLKRKFDAKVKVEYPDLAGRLALSEQEAGRGHPRALLLREGLLPYAETVAGGWRLCRAMRRGAGLSILGAAAGCLLSFYLTFQGVYDMMPPLRLLVFLLLWTLPVLLLDDWSGRY